MNKFYCENISLKRSQSVKKISFEAVFACRSKIWHLILYVFIYSVRKLLHAHSLGYETAIVDEAGWKWCIHRATGACSTDSSCPINDQHTALNPFLYVVLLWGLLAFFPPLIQLFWMTIMWFRHCLLFNYRTYLSLKHATLACKAPLYN